VNLVSFFSDLRRFCLRSLAEVLSHQVIMNNFQFSSQFSHFSSILGSLGMAFAETSISPSSLPPQPFSIKDLIGDGILWGVPKHRRTIEKRMRRKYGSADYILKTIQEKRHLRICDTCGNHCEVGLLCAHCYDKVRKETESIKEKIMKKLKLSPVDSEVVVLYDGEKPEKSEELWKGKRIVEMEKPRPQFFSKNLLQKSTQANAESKEIVKPDQLG
jgi:large subunit ribosomal protein L32